MFIDAFFNHGYIYYSRKTRNILCHEVFYFAALTGKLDSSVLYLIEIPNLSISHPFPIIEFALNVTIYTSLHFLR